MIDRAAEGKALIPADCPGHCAHIPGWALDREVVARRRALWPDKPKDPDALPTLEEGLEILRTRLKALDAMKADIEKKIEILEGA